MEQEMDKVTKMMGWRPQWSKPCDELGNPINKNGTIQAYAIKSDPVNRYAMKTYRFKHRTNDK